MIMEILDYLRNLLPSGKTNRKRSALDDLELPTTSKHRRISLSQRSSPEDDWISSSSSTLSANKFKRNFMDPMDVSLKPIFRPSTSIVIEDDDDFKKINDAKRSRIRVTSTPLLSKNKENGIAEQGSSAKFHNSAKKPIQKAKLLAPNSSYFNNFKSYRSSLFGNGKDSQPKSAMFGIKKQSFGTLASDLNYRLDEKRKYEELLSKTNKNISSLDYSSFAEYSTPCGKITPITRARKLVNLALKSPKAAGLIDLTNGDAKKPVDAKLSTKDTILKVLDTLDTNEPVVVKDSDSDVEILPCPPSPKPDIKVERINSIKTAVHPSEPQHDDWIENKIKKHAEQVSNLNKEIELQRKHLAQIQQITNDVQTKQLEEQVRKCLHIKDIVLPLEVEEKLPELTSEQENMVSVAFDRRKHSDEVLVSKFSLNIARRDLATLSGLNWLNDEVINFYMNLIIERGKMEGRLRSYAFNTFFYPKLLKDGHQSIRRWTRKIDIFAHDLICVPIHLSVHWCMATIDFRSKTVNYYDSMGKQNQTCTKALLEYLRDEHRDKKKSEYSVSDWTMISHKDIPQQMNGSDCGVFSCTFAEFAARNAPFNFSQEDMPYLRKKMVVEIMSGQLLIN